MSNLASGQTIETARGNLEGDRSERLLRFWSENDGLTDDQARQRLPEAVCLLLDSTGEIAGVSSVSAHDLPLIGGRPFWLYRAVLLPAAAETAKEMVDATYEALEKEYEHSGPIGLCMLVDDHALIEGRPEAYWMDTGFMYAGYVDGSQVRLRYFFDATISPGMPNSPNNYEWDPDAHALEERYRIERLDEIDEVTPDDVLALWAREGAVPEAEASRRVHEVMMVAIDKDDSLAGISSVYLQRNAQLGMDLWHFRTFVGTPHRGSNLSLQLLWTSRDHLEERFVAGEDTRGPGVIIELEHEGLKGWFNRAYWWPSKVSFIGENERGDHVRVYFFPGATAPPPG
jgi:hypothetical protein